MTEKEDEGITLSIIVAAWNGESSLRDCLDSLESQTDQTSLEVIVVSNFPFLEHKFSLPVRFFELPETATVPELRSEGISQSRGKIIALLEDHCTLDPNWCREIKRGHESAFGAVGGSVENAGTQRSLDWAAYFYDYGKYMLPNTEGPAEALSGINVSYKRKTLEEISELYKDGFFEAVVNEELKRSNHQLLMLPQAVVYHRKSYQVKRAAGHSFHLARSYAARRIADSSAVKPFYFTLASLLLPLLLPVRIISTTVKKGRNISQLIRAFPYIILLTILWSCGEFCGYLLGEGNSSAEWR